MCGLAGVCVWTIAGVCVVQLGCVSVPDSPQYEKNYHELLCSKAQQSVGNNTVFHDQIENMHR